MGSLRLIISAFFALVGLTAGAQQFFGGNFTWECLGGNQYEITFTMYRNCDAGLDNPATTQIFIYPSGCASNVIDMELNFVNAQEISDLCATELANSTCAGTGGATPGTSQ